ncbi:fibroblast growth factor-binding protein 2b [Trichomycterus rosablanca]|uniref:fibroblast growth factor-binding protein 2b n=1 Tax=Trichomycterus rosablanca TaxID=2290929 RepID=UPI002F35D026
MAGVVRAALLLACCVWTVDGQAQSADQGDGGAIVFNTKAKDSCTMTYSGQADLTKLRVSCKNESRSYWCEYLGKPDACRPYAANPRHYFNQIMWEMRKLRNACQGPDAYRPQMCRSAGERAQMALHRAWPRIQKRQQPGKAGKGGAPGPRPVQPRRPRPTAPRPTETAQSRAEKLAGEYCWGSMHGVCSYVFGWFQ